MFEVSVVYLLREGKTGDEVLLGEKLTGLGVGKIVGPGGKQEPGESPRHTAVREVAEEVGLVVAPNDLEPLARISYPFAGRDTLSQRSHAFTTRRWEGQLRASEEIDARWWPVSGIPLDRMWADARSLVTSSLGGRVSRGYFRDWSWQMKFSRAR